MQSLTDHHLVQALDEVTLEQAAFEKGFRDDPADEFEVAEMVWLHSRLGVRHVGRTVVRLEEERVIWIEHLLGQLDEEVPRQAADVLASLARKLDGDLAFQLLWSEVVDLGVGVREDLVSSDIERQTSCVRLSSQLLDLFPEVQTLVLKVEQVWHVLDVLGDSTELLGVALWLILVACVVGCPHNLVEDLLVGKAELVEVQ